MQMPKIAGQESFKSNLSWDEFETRKLCKAVDDLGGKVDRWYIILSENGEFPGRTAASINSYYNHLLRTMNPLISQDVLLKNKERLDRLKQRQRDRIERGERPPLKSDDPQWAEAIKDRSSVKRKKGTDEEIECSESQLETMTEDDIESRDDEHEIKDGPYFPVFKTTGDSLYGRVISALVRGKTSWPGVALPPDFELPSGSAAQRIQQNMNIKTHVIVYWFGDSAQYSLVSRRKIEDFIIESFRASGKQSSAVHDAYSFQRGYPANAADMEVFQKLGYVLGKRLRPALSNNTEDLFNPYNENQISKDMKALKNFSGKNFSNKVNHILLKLLRLDDIQFGTLRLICQPVAKIVFCPVLEHASLARELIQIWDKKYQILTPPCSPAKEETAEKEADLAIVPNVAAIRS